MGKVVQAVSAPVVQSVQSVAGGAKDILSGNISHGVKDIGGGLVDFGKAMLYESGYEGVKAVASDPLSAVQEGAGVAAAIGTGGLALPALGDLGVGSSLLTGLQGLAPALLAKGGGGGAAAPTPQPVSTPVLVSQPQSSMGPILLLGGGALLMTLLRRKGVI